MKSMRHTISTALAAATLASAAAVGAAPIDSSALAVKLDPGVYNPANPVGLVKAQWFFGGRNYCWYPDGWHGPGYYWCGYANRRGFGWGGPAGWHGWRNDRGMRDRGWRGDHRGWNRDQRDHRDNRDNRPYDRGGDNYPH